MGKVMEAEKGKPGPKVGSHNSKRRKPASRFPRTPDVPAEVVGNSQRGAWQKGWNAAREGKPATECPYSPIRPTFERGLWRLWREGYEAAGGQL